MNRRFFIGLLAFIPWIGKPKKEIWAADDWRCRTRMKDGEIAGDSIQVLRYGQNIEIRRINLESKSEVPLCPLSIEDALCLKLCLSDLLHEYGIENPDHRVTNLETRP